MKKIVIASHNPVKLQAARNGFQRMFPGEPFEWISLSISSGVAEQPMTDAETCLGAQNRAQGAAHLRPDASFTVGIEGGIEQRPDGMIAFAWVAIQSGSRLGKARTGAFFLPDEVARLIQEGKELGEADDIVFQRNNSKQENGAVGLLTANVIDRTQLYEQAVILALIPLVNPHLYR